MTDPRCLHECEMPPVFPAVIENRPGLPTIRYRVGTYADLRAHMFALLDASSPLHAWTHRLPDDPGIALIEATAEVGDILSLYHELYANEAYLRTAKWRDSVSDLVRLLGYRLAPGLGGRARFALIVKGDRPVVVPAGVGIKAQLANDPKPAVFETIAPITARAGLSQFRLYRPRVTPNIVDGRDTFAIESTFGVTLKPGDRIMVAVPRAKGVFGNEQILIVEKTWESFGTTVVKTKGRVELFDITTPTASALRAWKLGATFRHFGHNAPPVWTELDGNNRATLHTTQFHRYLALPAGSSVTPPVSPRDMPLDAEVQTVGAGTTLLAEATLRGTRADTRRLLIERTVIRVDRRSLMYGGLSGGSTILTLDDDLAVADGGKQFTWADIRDITLHQVDAPSFTLHATPVPITAARGAALDYYGLLDDANALRDRLVLLDDGRTPPRPVAVLDVIPAQSDATHSTFHRVRLDHDVTYASYDHDTPTITVYGNLVDATQGKTEAEVTVGDGDGRQSFQTFLIPKPPLTYLLDTTQVPPQLPELTVWVDRIQWHRVPSLYGCAANEHAYIVREDADGKSYLQFGDGKTGARLPSGRGNVVAQFRTGSGAHGPLAPDAKPQVDKRVAGIDAAFMREPATGGAPPESEAGARIAAPGTMQSLGRIVSLADYEAEALALPGVLKARAVWTPVDNVPIVRVTVFTASEAPADATATADALRAAASARGAARASLMVIQGARRRVTIGLVAGIDPDRRVDDVRAAILHSLGARAETEDVLAVEEGLFGWRYRQFGQGVHASQIIGAMQNTDGVVWVRLVALGTAAPLGFSARLRTPLASPFLLERLTNASRRSLACDSDTLLALDASDVSLTLSAQREENIA